jgi:putative Mg2+ transporter-C (MgtC) family protein
MSFNIDVFKIEILKLAVAYILAVPIGLNRAASEHTAGLRTFPLVAVASCGFVVAITSEFASESAEYSRVMQGVVQGIIAGIGFIGGGAILKDKFSVKGTATAASLWVTCAIGVASGFGNYIVAAFLTVVTFLTLRYIKKIEDKLDRNGRQECSGGDSHSS